LISYTEANTGSATQSLLLAKTFRYTNVETVW